MQSAIQALKDALGSDDAEQIKAKTESLAQVAMKLGEAMYKAQQEPVAVLRRPARRCRAGRRRRQGR